MIVLEIENIKEFMAHLFHGEIFDSFCVKESEIITFTTFHVDGKRQKDWYETDEKMENTNNLLFWKELKTYIFDWIKGNKTPKKMMIDLCHYFSDGDVGYLRITYESERLLLYTGYMQTSFSLDKSKQQQWDENCVNFIKKNKIVSTQIE